MCENSGVLSVVLLLKDVINFISIIVPIILILMVSVDVFKMVGGDTNVYNQKIKGTIKKAIAAVLVFFVPTFVNLLLSLLGSDGYQTSFCWINANNETIAEVKELEEARRLIDEEKKAQEKKKADDERKAVEELREEARKENEKEAEEAEKNNSSSSSSSPSGEVFPSTKYDLTETQLIHLARVCKAEQGSVAGAAAEATLMANLFESKGKNYGTGGDGLYNYVRTGRWFAHAADHMDNGSYTPEILAAVKDVLVNGNRVMPSNVVEHDCWFCNNGKYCNNGNKGDICKIIVGGKTLTSAADIKNRSNYIKDDTVIYNVYGSIYKFYMFPSERADPFGYIIGYY